MNRENMKIDTFYVLPDGITFITPDGIGGYWYDTLEHAIADNGNYPSYKVTEIN